MSHEFGINLIYCWWLLFKISVMVNFSDLPTIKGQLGVCIFPLHSTKRLLLLSLELSNLFVLLTQRWRSSLRWAWGPQKLDCINRRFFLYEFDAFIVCPKFPAWIKIRFYKFIAIYISNMKVNFVLPQLSRNGRH